MEPDHIKILLEKYWQAETTAAEEAELRAYFKNIDPKEQELAALFRYFDMEHELTVSARLDNQLQSRFKSGPPRKIWSNIYLQAAAAVLLLVSALLFITLHKPGKATAVNYVDTYRDPREALNEAKKSLLLISQNLNKGKQYALQLKQVEKAQQLLKSKIQP